MTSKRVGVLLVEDNPDDRELIVEMLSQTRDLNFDVRCAESLASALEHLRDESFAAILLDLNLPDSDGLTTFLKAKSLVRDTPIVVLTGLADDALGLQIISDGGQDFLVKGEVHRHALARAVLYAIERQELQARVHAMEAERERLFNASLDLLCIADSNGHFKRVNPAFSRVLGYSEKELLSRPFIEFVHPADRQTTLAELQKLAEGVDAVCFENRYRAKDGSHRWLEWAIPAAHEDTTTLYAVARDITRRKQAEEALRASEGRYRSVVQASGEAIVSLTIDAVVQTWNPAAERMFGYSAEEMMGATFSQLLPPDRSGELDQLFSRIRDGQAVVGLETQKRTKDGRLLDVVLNIQPIVDEAGKVTGAVGTACDLTEYKRAQDQLRRLDAEVARISRATTIGVMATALAHELSQPLGAAANYAGGCCELIESGNASPADLLSTLRQLSQQIDQSAGIIRRLREFVSKAMPKKRRIDLNDLVREVDRLVPMEVTESQIKRRFELDPDLPKVQGDPVQIKQVLVNLIRNAIDAAAEALGPRGEVAVRTSVTQGKPIVSVVDNGRGIPANQLDRIFEPYFTTKPDGVGLGLSICRTIVQNHGGRLWAEASWQGGACFCFTLPLADDAATNGATPG